jgi:hypothetical protein
LALEGLLRANIMEKRDSSWQQAAGFCEKRQGFWQK